MSEFGKGFVYCIGLFLAHAERDMTNMEKCGIDYHIMFNGAADHLFELEIPNRLPKAFKVVVRNWRDFCIGKRLESASKDEWLYAIQRAKDILLAYDLYLKIPAEKGEYE